MHLDTFVQIYVLLTALLLLALGLVWERKDIGNAIIKSVMIVLAISGAIIIAKSYLYL